MKTKWTQMSTVYAGPFSKDCNVGALKKVFSSLGPVHSITLVLETYRTRKVNHPKIVAWRWSRKIEKLYHSLSPGTFCLILMPGTKNAFGSHPGLGLMKIKEEEESDTPGVRV